jgi:enoyl-CoA hydratase
VIRAERRGRVAVVSIDRPERRNAVDVEACRQLAAAVERSGDARAVVLTGVGPHFCAGADLASVEDTAFLDALRAALFALRDVPCPVVAAVHGAALGAGTQLALACDLRVAAPGARFGIPAARLGVMVDHWTVQRLSLLAGHGPARAMLMAAEELDDEAAVRSGLAQRLGTFDDALVWADEIARLAPLTVTGHKLALNRLEADVGDDPDVAEAFDRAWRSGDVAEGMAAFRERRPPQFRGE